MTSALVAPVGDNTSAGSCRLVLAAGLAFYLDAATLVSVSVALPVWRDVYQQSVWQVGLVGGGLAFALAAGSVVGGWLADRFGRDRVFTYDLVAFCAGTAMITVAPTDDVLTCGVLVVGLATGVDVPTALAVIADAVPVARRGRATGLTQLLWITAVLVTLALGVAVSDLGLQGTRMLGAHLVALALLTLGLRLSLVRRDPLRPAGRILRTPLRRPLVLRRLLQVDALRPLLLLTTFYVCWSAASGTLGSYGTYFLVSVTGLDQRTATALVFAAFLPALAMVTLFVHLADTRWRDRLFVAAALLQVAGLATGAATGGGMVAGMVALTGLYSLSNVFAGEAIYKVWSQLLFPDEVRATAIGVSYGLARAVTATFLLFVPALAAVSPAVVLWALTVSVTCSGVVGLVIIRSDVLRRMHPLAPSRWATTRGRTGVDQAS